MATAGTPFRHTGLQALEAGKLTEAKGALQQSLRLDPTSFEAWCYLGAACSRLDEHDNARKAFGRALQLRADDPSVWYNLGVVQHRAGDDAAAKTCFHSALERNAKYAPAQQALEALDPHIPTMSELAGGGGHVRLAGAHSESMGDEAPVAGGHTLTAAELARLATPEGDMHVPGAELHEGSE